MWEDQFCDMLDNIVSLNKEYLLLGDFNIALMFPKHPWNSFISSFNLQQLIKYPTRVTVNTCTLLDHIYVDINCSFKEICVVQCGLSDHFPICITLGFDKVKSSPKIILRFDSEVLIILILTHLLRTKILIYLKIYSVYLTKITVGTDFYFYL